MINNKTHIETIVGLVQKIAQKESEKTKEYNLNTGTTIAIIGEWINKNGSHFNLGIDLKSGKISSCNQNEFLNCDIKSIELNDDWKEQIKKVKQSIKESHNTNYDDGVVAITELVNFLYGGD